jgi:cation diffusion facilitator family transporter
MSVLKVIGGIVGRSGALVADGIHSLSDFLTDIVVLVMVGVSHKKPDNDHLYGHGKYETFATMLVAVALIVVGLSLFSTGASTVIDYVHGVALPRPEWIALALCGLSIAVKEWLFHYTRRVGEEIGSGAVIANAWHHRSDAFTSVATFIGVGGAIMLGEKWRVLDPVATMFVAAFIVIMGIKIATPAIKELLEASLPEAMVSQIRASIVTTEGVRGYHKLRTRRNGSSIIVETHLLVDPDITVAQGHAIADAVEAAIRAQIGANALITTHIEPYYRR